MPDFDDAVSLARVSWGLTLLARPRAVSGLGETHPAGEPMAVAARILGARHVLQTFAERRWPSRGLRRVGAGIDGIHAVVMGGLALLPVAGRRDALITATVAAALAVEQLTVPERHEAGR
jgi:hypothetical protein